MLRKLYSNRNSQQLNVVLTENRIRHIGSAFKTYLTSTTMKRLPPTFVDCFNSLDVVLLTASVSIRAFRYLTGRHIAQANVAVGSGH